MVGWMLRSHALVAQPVGGRSRRPKSSPTWRPMRRLVPGELVGPTCARRVCTPPRSLSGASCVTAGSWRVRSPVTRSGVRALSRPGNLGLLSARTPDLVTGLLTRQDPAVTQLAPLSDLGGVQTLLAQVGPTSSPGTSRLIGRQVGELLGRRERPPTGWATKAWLRSIHPTIVAHRCKS